MSDAQVPQPPREPEIEFLGKLAHGALVVARIVLALAGIAAICYGCWQAYYGSAWPLVAPDSEVPTPAGSSPAGSSIVWFTVGLPLVVPADCWLTKNRYRPWLLGISAVLWFAPSLIGDATQYGYILRMFATLIAVMSLLVWRTLWRLTEQPAT